MFEWTPLEALGMVAGFLSAFSAMPQTIKIIKLKQAEAVSAVTYLMLGTSYSLWIIYGIAQGLISILFWNFIAVFICGAVLYLKLVVWKEK